MQPVLETPRLVLRPFTLEDAPAVQRIAATYSVAQFMMELPHPFPEGAAEAWIRTHAKNFADGKVADYAITDKINGEVYGAVSLGIQPYDRGSLGYWLGEAYWGQGYATEAAKAMLDFAFTYYKLNRIYAVYYTGNDASGRILQKLGMSYEGTLRQHFKRWDRYFDGVYYGILREEWQKRTETSIG